MSRKRSLIPPVESRSVKFDPEETLLLSTLEMVPDEDHQVFTLRIRAVLKEYKRQFEALHKETREQHELLHGYEDQQKRHQSGLLQRCENLEQWKEEQLEKEKKLKWTISILVAIGSLIAPVVLTLGTAMLKKMGVL